VLLILTSFASIIAKEQGKLIPEKIKVHCVCKKNALNNKNEKYQKQLRQWFISVGIPPPPEDIIFSQIQN
jgi:hypothetical protein